MYTLKEKWILPAMLKRTLPILLSKRVTIPSLSPTHTKARILCFEVIHGEEVSAYNPVMILQCSSDLVTEAFRERVDETKFMLVEIQDKAVMGEL